MSLTLKDFQKKYDHHVNRGLSMHSIKFVMEHTIFDFDVYLESKGKNLQRDLCWTIEQKTALILTILRDQTINPIVVVQHKETDYRLNNLNNFLVIDGKQRLTTVFDYIDNKFSVNLKGQNYFFNDLPKELQKQILLYDFRWDIHYSYWDRKISDNTLIDIFEDCNFLGTPQDIEHLNKLRDE